MKKILFVFIITICITNLYARAGGGHSYSSSRSSFSSSRPSYGSSSKSYGSSSKSYSSSSSKSYSSSSGGYLAPRTSSMRIYSTSFPKGITINNYNVTNISQHTGYQPSHPFNNPFVWMMIMNSNKHSNTKLSDSDFEKQAHALLLKKVCDDFYLQ